MRRVGRLRSSLAAAAMGLAYVAVWLMARLLRPRGPRAFASSGRILVTGTFHNPGWSEAHLRPLGLSGVGAVLVVTDPGQVEVDGVELAPPPRWASALLGRALSRLAWMIVLSLRHRPDLYMGYHLLPNALAALAVARLFGRPACYQMTGGPVEIAGGGNRSLGNPVMSSLGRPRAWLERLALAVVGEFDLVVVRGSGGARFLDEHGIGRRSAIVTGSVDGARFRGQDDRVWDLVFVGRLVEGKQPLEFLEIVAEVARRRPLVRAALLGSGPLLDAARRRIASLGATVSVDLPGQVADVAAVLGRARVFVLPSLSEGLSIALAEAMMCGAVPLATRVGDLGDLVADGENGYLLSPDDREGFVREACALLADGALWARMSQGATASARALMELDRVASLWGVHLRATIERAGGGRPGAARVASETCRR
jgi:glycosyltransferase involved in cell wall biosynthesis